MGVAESWRRSAVELSAAYRRRELSPSEVLESHLERIEAANPQVNAFVALRREQARQEALASDERFRIGAPLSSLDGVPIAVKDNITTADLPTTWGTPAGRNRIFGQDELAVASACRAGAIVLGKTNVPEFTLEGYTSNPVFGTTRNPWDLRLTPGGSSGGSVAAVAAGMVPLSLVTDGGGSTRRPASHTGLVGYKPSIGAIARDAGLPPLLLDFEVIGTIGRNLADVRLLFDTVRGPHRADRRSDAASVRKPLPSHLRVLYVPAIDGAPVDPQVAASCRDAADRLANLGHDVRHGALPLDLDLFTEGWARIGQIGLAWLFEHHPAWRDGASEKYLEMAELGARLPAAALWQILEKVEHLRRQASGMFAQVDLVAMPCAAALPWAADAPYPTSIAGLRVGPRGHAVFTGWVNAAGLPGLALPCVPSAEGLPKGIQLISVYGTDEALLDAAVAIEAAVSPAWRWPMP